MVRLARGRENIQRAVTHGARNALLMPEVRREQLNWFKVTERQEELQQTLVASEVCRIIRRPETQAGVAGLNDGR